MLPHKGFIHTEAIEARAFVMDDTGLFPWVCEVAMPSLPWRDTRAWVVSLWSDPQARERLRPRHEAEAGEEEN